MNEVIELEKATLVFRVDGIVEIRFRDDIEVLVEDSQSQFELISKRYAKGEALILIVPGEHNVIDPGVREYANEPGPSSFPKAEAVIANNLAQRLIVNFYMNFLERNIKLFSSEKEAIRWLKKQQ